MSKEFIYFFKCNDFLKVGRTVQPLKKRLSAVQSGNPYEVTLAGFIQLNPCAQSLNAVGKIEKQIHEHLSSFHVRREWFKAELDDLAPLLLGPSIFLPFEAVIMSPEIKSIMEARNGK